MRRLNKYKTVEIPPVLESVSASLRKISEESESDFIEIGRELQSYFYEADDLTKTIIKTIHLMDDDSGQNLAEKIGTHAKETFSEIHQFQEAIRGSLIKIDLIIGNLELLLAKCQQIKKAALFTKIIALNMGVENSRSITSKEQFSIVAKETKNLSQRIKEIIDPIHSDFLESKTKQIKARKSIADDLASLSALDKEAGNMLNKAVQRLETVMTLSINALKSAEIQSREISRYVGEVVAGIQLHDSMRQRIEHITNSFPDIIGLCSCIDTDTADQIFSEDRLNQAHSILELQSAHIKQMICDIESVHEKSSSAFAKISSHVGLLSESLSGTGTPAIGQNNVKEAMEDIGEILINLNGLFQKSGALADQIGHMASMASDNADRFTSYAKDIKEISLEMHLKALNAIIMATHLGKTGKTQDILACELKERSKETNEFANRIVETLEVVTASAVGLKKIIDFKGSGYENGEISLEKDISRLSRVFGDFKSESSESKKRVEGLKQSIMQTREGLGFLPDLAGQLSMLLNDLERVKEIINPEGNRNKFFLKEMEERISAKYTMERERQIHQEIFEKNGDRPSEHFEKPQPRLLQIKAGRESEIRGKDEDVYKLAGEEDGLGDNVELF